MRAALTAVRPYGTVVLMGGLGMRPEIQLPYFWPMHFCITVRGQWMLPREALQAMVGMIRAGLIDLGHHKATSFALERVNEAVAHAAAHAGPFSRSVLDLRPARALRQAPAATPRFPWNSQPGEVFNLRLAMRRRPAGRSARSAMW